MMRPSAGADVRLTFAAVAAIAAAGVIAGYGHTLGYGLRYDDYHTVRPWTLGELLQVLHGTWDPTGIEPVFYRPLSAWWYAVRFQLFGLDAVLPHAISLLGMILCAFLLGVFVWREQVGPRAALFAAGIYAIHPALVYAQGIWLTNQMHLLTSVTVLLALLFWQRVRTEPTLRRWWPILALQVVAFGFKEDAIVLAPLLVLLTVVRALVVRDTPLPGWPVALGVVALTGGLFVWRYEALGNLGGYGAVPGPERAWLNLKAGLASVLMLEPARRPWQVTASAFSKTILVAGGLLSLRRHRLTWLFLSGLAMAAIFNLPFFLVTKVEQYHLIALGAAIALAGGIEAVIDSLVAVTAGRLSSRVVALPFLVGAASFVPVTRDIAGDFDPCSSFTLETDRVAMDWWVVPPEIQDWLKTKPKACEEGRPAALTSQLASATWAYGREMDERGRPFQWTSDRAVMLVTSRVRELVLDVRRPNLPPDAGITVIVKGPVATTTARLATPDWQRLTVPLEATIRSRVGGMHRVDLMVPQTFVPALEDRGSSDSRRLGVQLRIVEPAPPR